MFNVLMSVLVPVIVFVVVFFLPIKLAYFWCSRSLHGTRRKTFGGVSLLLGIQLILLALKTGESSHAIGGNALGIFGIAILSWTRDQQ